MRQYITGISTLIAMAAVLAGAIWLGRPCPLEVTANIPKPLAAAMIEAKRPMRRDFYKRLYWFGRVESKATWRLMALTSGQITAIKAMDGSPVRKGNILFILGGPRIKHKLKALRQHVATIEEQVSLAMGIVRMRRDAMAEKMAKREDLLSAQEHLARLKDDLSTAKKELSVLRDALIVRSPGDGIFTNRQVSPGQDVEQGAHLADVISPELRISARLFPYTGVSLDGKRAVVQMAFGSEITGTVVRVLPERTAEGATVIWIEGTKITRYMKPGEGASGWIVLEVQRNCLAVPRDAIVRDEQERTFVFVKTPQGYRKKAVKIGLWDGAWCEIVSGLSGNEEVVTRGAYELFYRDFTKTYKVAD